MVRSGGSLRPDELPKRQKALRQISVSECEFSKAVDKVYLIRTGTALGDIHVAGRLSQTSCLLHPDDSPLLKKISTRSDRHLPEGLLPLREFIWFANIYFINFPFIQSQSASDIHSPFPSGSLRPDFPDRSDCGGYPDPASAEIREKASVWRQPGW